MRLSQLPCCPSPNFLSCLLCNMCLHGTTLCSLFQGPNSCTQERIYQSKKAWCKEWGKTFWSHPTVHWSFLSSTISYSNVKSTWSYLSSLSTSVTSLSAKQSLSLTMFGSLSPANVVPAAPTLLRGKQKRIFGIISLSHKQWSVC